MADLATLGFAVDSAPLKALANDLNAVVPAAEKTERAVDKAGKGVEGAMGRVGGASKMTERMLAAMERIEKAVRDVERAMGPMSASVSRSTQAMEKAVQANDNAAKTAEKAGAAYGTMGGAAERTQRTITEAAKATEQAASVHKRLDETVSSSVRNMGLYVDAQGKLRSATGGWTSNIEKAEAVTLAMAGALDEQSTAALRAVGALNEHAVAAGRAAQQFAAIVGPVDALSQPFEQATAAYERLTGALSNNVIGDGRFQQDVERVRQAFIENGGTVDQWGTIVERNAQQASNSMGGLEGAVGLVKRALAGLGIALGIREVASFADTWSDLSARVGLAVGSMDAAPLVMERLATIADNTYSSLELTAESFTRNAASLRELGLSTEQQLQYLSSLNDALVVSGARGDRARQVQDALSKAMVLGKLSGDELNAVMVHGGAISAALAEELGVAENSLRALGAEGKISGSLIRDTLISRVEEFREKAGLMPATIEDGMGRIRNALLQTIGVFDQQNKLSESVAERFVDIADAIKGIPENFDTIARGAAVAGVAIGGAFAPALIGSMATAFVALGSAGVGAVTAITAAMAANPLGALAVAIATTITALYLFRDEIASVLGVDLIDVARRTANEFIGLFVGAYDAVQGAWSNLPNFMSAVGKQAWNALVSEFEKPALTVTLPGLGERTLIPGLDLSALKSDLNTVESMALDKATARFSEGFRRDYIPALGAAAGATRDAEDAVADLNAMLGETPGAAAGTAVLTEEQKKAAEAIKKATEAFEAQRRTLAQNTEGLQRQIDLFGATAGATAAAELRAKELARAWDIAREAGLKALPETTKTAIDNAAASVENLTNQLERMNLERGQDDAMRMLEAEAGLIGMSAEARKVAMAGLEAEQRLRSQNIVTTDAWGQAYIRNAQAAAGMRVEIDRQTKAYETQQQFVENVLSTSLDALFNVGKAESWGEAVLGIFADIGRQFQELAKQNLMQAVFGQNYTTGQLAPGQRSIAQPGFPAGFGGAPVATNQNVAAGGAINVRAVTALNDNLQRSSRSALDVARQFDGLNERADSAVLDSFMQASGNWRNLSAADTAWCAAFANAAIAQAGGKGTNSNLASSFMGWGQGTNTPQVGDIVVLKPQARGASGHVGFVAGFGDGTVQVFGGNQSNAANTRSFGLDQVRGYRTGVGVSGAGVGGSFAMPQMPAYAAPQMSSAAQQAMAGGWSGFGPVPGQSGRSTVGMFGQNGRISQIMQSPLGQMGMMGIGAFGSGYQSGSAGSGGLSGALTGFMSGGPVGALIGGAAGLLGGLFGGRQKRKQEHQQRAEAWAAQAQEWAAYQDEVRTGVGPTSGLRASQEAMAGRLTGFVQTGSAAWKMGSNNSSALFSQVSAELGEYFARTNAEFGRAYEAQIASLNAGQGLSGPFISARDEILEAGKTLATFVDDTRVVFGDGSVEAQRAAEASIAQLRALLTGGQELSDIAAAVEQMRGAAAGLHTQLEMLGVSAADAGAAVSQDLAAAMNRLRGDFAQGIQDQLWSLDGKGYITEFRQFFIDIDGAIQDALLIGADRGLVDELFVREAQSRINDAQLSGEAFNELLSVFPRLAGVVREFSEAAEEAAKRTVDQIAALKLSYEDRFFETTIDTSTEAGALARFDRYAAREREEEIKAGGDAILELERALAAERGQIVKQFADRAIEEQKRALESAQSFLDGFTRDIGSYLDGLRAGPDSPLTGQARVNEAQAQFDKQYALAMTGDRDALSSITGYADRLIEADRAYNTSSPAAQATFDRVMSALENLPKLLKPEDLLDKAIRETALDTQEAIRQAAVDLAGRISTDFDKLDTNLDGLLSFDELKTAGLATDAELKRIYAEIDLNGDNQISRLEGLLASDGLTRSTLVTAFGQGPAQTAGALAPHFARLDTSVNGLLDFNEMRAALGGIATDVQIRQMMTVLDENGDGQISRLELLNASSRTQTGSLTEMQRLTQLVWQTGVNSAVYQERTRHFTEVNSQLLQNISTTLANSLSMQERIRANLAAANGMTGARQFMTGGYTGGSSPTEVRGVVHGMEGVLTAQAMKGVGIPALDFMNREHRLPAIAMPIPSVVRAENDNGSVTELRQLRADIARLEKALVSATLASGENVRDGVDGLAEASAGSGRKARREKARTGSQ